MIEKQSSNSRSQYIIDDGNSGLFKVARKAFVEQDVWQQEQARIFDRCWLYLGHESEVASPNDFVTRAIAGRNLIFNRDASGEVNAFYNTCTHRGAFVCREAKGSSKLFQCFYHGWVYSSEGKLIDQPGKTAYCENFNHDGSSNLARVERLESYRGLYFINFDRNAVSLDTYLGEVREYIDLVMDQAETRMEVVGGTQAYAIDANWKLLCENSIDGYHAVTTHATYLDYLSNTAGSMTNSDMWGAARQFGGGHAAIEYSAPWGRPVARHVAAWGEEGKKDLDAIMARLSQKYGEERARRIGLLNRNILIFPNLVLNDIMAITLRTFYPLSPDRMHVNAWALGPQEETSAMRERRLFNFLEFLGPGGFATPDDVEALEMCQRGYKNLRAVAWNDISKGMTREEPGTSDELQMRAFWRHWNSLMTAQEAAE
ncbi:MAG: aromatic ring-hydroxylating dioxygenase subunit alpha [Alphaproteobacteria bacterium]|nr:aromatic ring-hydroxylating dioxygenase subunit alpha [Alphaproteobacteria bacterium]